jgi:hypothetical protein
MEPRKIDTRKNWTQDLEIHIAFLKWTDQIYVNDYVTVLYALQENSHLAAAKNGRKVLKTAGKFQKWQN